MSGQATFNHAKPVIEAVGLGHALLGGEVTKAASLVDAQPDWHPASGTTTNGASTEGRRREKGNRLRGTDPQKAALHVGSTIR